ncbi:hypothetical protein STEG23_021030 [Scotinomys teguina]
MAACIRRIAQKKLMGQLDHMSLWWKQENPHLSKVDGEHQLPLTARFVEWQECAEVPALLQSPQDPTLSDPLCPLGLEQGCPPGKAFGSYRFVFLTQPALWTDLPQSRAFTKLSLPVPIPELKLKVTASSLHSQ